MRSIFLDIETTGLSPFDSDIALVQLLPKGGNPILIQNTDEIGKFKDILERNLIIGHNLKFDTKFLKYHYDINITNIFDTYLAELVISGGLQAGRSGAKLSDLARKYLNIELDKTEQTGFTPGQELTEEQTRYACLDVEVLPGIYKAQQKIIALNGLTDTINIEMNCIPATVWLELSGIPFDLAGMEVIKQKAIIDKTRLSDQIKEILRPRNLEDQQDLNGDGVFEINLKSPYQLLKALQNTGIEIKDTRDETLSSIYHPIGQLLKEYRAQEKLLSGFITKIPGFIYPLDKRIHADFNQFGAHSGRYTCSRPNLQQQPNTEEWRGLFKAGKGNKIITADYSQIELRILAEVSKDKEFTKAFNDGVDLHALTASKVFKVSINEVTKEQRATAKTVNFGIAYGMWTDGLIKRMKQSDVELTQGEAKTIINNFYKGYPGVSRYLHHVSEKGLINLKLRNIAGRLIKFNKPATDQLRGSIKRQSKNLPIQSVCADILKIAMAKLYHELAIFPDVKLINCVHDELVFEVSEDKADAVAEIVERVMVSSAEKFIISVPVIVDVNISEAWVK